MSQLIQRAPLGLLSILDSKAGGQNPNVLSDTVTTTLNALPLYEVQNRLSRNSQILAGAIVQGFNDGAPTLLQPQPGEIWHVLGLSVRGEAGIGAANFKATVGFRDLRNNGFLPVCDYQNFPVAGNLPVLGAPCDYWMTPSEIVSMFVVQTTGAVDVQLAAFFNRFTV